MFFHGIKEVVLEGAVGVHKSAADKAVERCNKINWFLYKSDYVLGRKTWDNVSMSTKAAVLSGIVSYVMLSDDVVQFMDINTTVPYRRVRGVV